jgi:cytochrome c
MLLLISAAILSACNDPEPGSGKQPSAVTATPDPELGKALYAASCKGCHGKDVMGTKHGPPLIHKIYKPGHHADFSFYRAVSFGVKSHHWRFGDMPKIPGVSAQEAAHIIAFVRQEQRRAGIR